MKENILTNKPTKNLADGQPVQLTTTMGSTGSATAWITGNRIIVNCAAALHSNTVTISTPINFEVIDVHTIQGAGTSSTVIVKNGSSTISSTITAGADKAIVRATTIDDAYSSFSNGDNDLVLTIGAEAFTGIVIITIDR